MYSPSFDREVITEIGFLYFECSISSRCACQNARMYCGVLAMFSTRTCRTRSVAWKVRMKRLARKETSFTVYERAVYQRAHGKICL